MSSRYQQRERQYRRRMAVCYPLAAVLWVLVLLGVPRDRIPLPDPDRIGLRGPLALLPEVDILPDEERDEHMTAAARPSAPTDFQVLDIDIVETSHAEPIPEPSPAAAETRDVPREEPVVPDLQEAIRTTAHPVLADTQYEILHFERPVYPAEAIARGIEGRVEVLLLVDTGGRVAEAYVVRPNRIPLLESAAMLAVQKTRFRAYVVGGEPTAFWVKVPIEFRLVTRRRP